MKLSHFVWWLRPASMTRKVTQPRGLHFIEIFSLVKIFLGSRKYFTMTKLIQITLLFVSNSSRYWVLIYLLFFFSKPSLICLPPPYYWNEIFVENRRQKRRAELETIWLDNKYDWVWEKGEMMSAVGLIICYTLFTPRQSSTFPEL